MNTISTIVVDDEPIGRKNLERMLSADPDIRIVASCHDGRVAVDRIRELRPDLAFLDVQLPHLDGFEVLEKLDPINRPRVVFVSGYEEHAIRAFDVSAVDYLLKPYTKARFDKALGRAKEAIRRLHAEQLTEQVEQLLDYAKELQGSPAPAVPRESVASNNDKLVLKAGGALYFTKASDVIWMEAQGDFVKVQTRSKVQLVRETLQNLELKLDPSKFLRIHRSFVVNLDHVDRVETALYGDYSVYMRDGTKLRLSRNHRAKLKALVDRGALAPTELS